jgi:hypothetical protein
VYLIFKNQPSGVSNGRDGKTAADLPTPVATFPMGIASLPTLVDCLVSNTVNPDATTGNAEQSKNIENPEAHEIFR